MPDCLVWVPRPRSHPPHTYFFRFCHLPPACRIYDSTIKMVTDHCQPQGWLARAVATARCFTILLSGSLRCGVREVARVRSIQDAAAVPLRSVLAGIRSVFASCDFQVLRTALQFSEAASRASLQLECIGGSVAGRGRWQWLSVYRRGSLGTEGVCVCVYVSYYRSLCTLRGSLCT